MKTWLGVIVITYKTNPYRILIIENKKTGNITSISGAVNNEETLEEAAIREIKEEIDWTINQEQLQKTSIKQEFIYGPQKEERAGDKGINQVFLLNADNLPEPKETNDTKNAMWATIEKAKKKITFNDLKEIIEETSKIISHLH
jgi:ADP-ribose pyrophosphatase YjhB (NUDIX family)